MRTEGVQSNLVNGVSRQPEAVRLPSQVQDQLNCFSTISKGLRKRPPARYVSSFPKPPAGSHVHVIERDDTERYIVALQSDGIQVRDLTTGAAKTVNAPNGFGYLNCSNPETQLGFLNTLDVSWIVNKTKTVAARPDIAPVRLPEALIYVNNAEYSVTYELFITYQGVRTRVAALRTPNGTGDSDTERLAAQRLATKEGVAGTMVNGNNEQYSGKHMNELNGGNIWVSFRGTIDETIWGVEQYKEVIHIWNKLGNEFEIECRSNQSGDHVRVFKGETTDFSKLPSLGPDGFILGVSGDEDTDWDDYWVEFKHSSNEPEGVWNETVKPGTPLGLDASTLPHKLTREADGTFTFAPSDWSDRKVGDIELSANPTCVGKELEGVAFWKNRLVLYGDENIIMSESGQYTNLFRTTVMQTLDSDPIDIEIAYPDLSKIQSVVPFKDNLILFSDNVQFRMEGDELITPKTAHFKPITNFYSNKNAKPIAVGQSLFFLASPDYSDGAKFREFTFDIDFGFREGSEITDHIEGYIPSSVFNMTASLVSRVLAVQARSTPRRVYMYKYYWRNKETKIQSAWSSWDFNMDVVFCKISRDDLILLLDDGANIRVESVPLAEGFSDYEDKLIYHLDHRLTQAQVTSTYNATTGFTEVVAPFSLDAATIAVRRDGVALQVDHIDTNIIHLVGDQTGEQFFIGVPFLSELTFSRMVPQRKSGDDTVAVDANLVLTTFSIHLSDTAYLKFIIEDLYRDPYEVEFTGYVGDVNRKVGEVPLLTDQCTVSVDANVDDVTLKVQSESYLPFALVSTHWIGNLGPRR